VTTQGRPRISAQRQHALEVVRELQRREAAGHPVVVNWPTDRDLEPATRRLYATAGVLVRFVPPER
jgi:hypothetical protein